MNIKKPKKKTGFRIDLSNNNSLDGDYEKY